MIRSVFLAAASTVILGSVAMAADLPTAKGPPVYAPPPPPVFSWTGLYIGAQVGYEWGRSPSTAFPAGAAPIVEPTLNDSGIVGGGHIGYNYQMSQFVIGVEGDMNGSGYSGSSVDATGFYGLRTRIPIDGSVRGRVGVAFDRALIYATGGAALGNIHSSVTQLFGAGLGQTVNALRVGWTVGGGVEYAIDNNWSVRAEYRYTDYGRTTWAYGFPVLPVSTAVRLHETDSRAQAGFSYKFDWAPPPAPAVVSKY